MQAWPRLLLSFLLLLNAAAMPWLHARCMAEMDAPVTAHAMPCHQDPAPQDLRGGNCHCACCVLPSTAPSMLPLVLATVPPPPAPVAEPLDWPPSLDLAPGLRPPIG